MNKFKISVLSNITLEPFFSEYLTYLFDEKLDIDYVSYEDISELIHKEIFCESNIVVVILNFERLYADCYYMLFSEQIVVDNFIEEAAELCRTICIEILKNTKGKILWFLFENSNQLVNVFGRCIFDNALIDRINLKIIDKMCCYDNVIIMNTQSMITSIGEKNAYNIKNKYRWNLPYSEKMIEKICFEILKQCRIQTGIIKKCIVLDCDNVLWGGIITEEGIENIKLDSNGYGRRYKEFQSFILALYYCGIILAICSKNDLDDVMAVFDNHSEMVLQKEHIACFQINWRSKSENIKKIAETLNIDLDSIIFIDDMSSEIEEVKQVLPEVCSILYDNDTIYDLLSYLNLNYKVNAGSIKSRMETYRTNIKRENLRVSCKSFNEYISALEVEIEITKTDLIEVSRISELTQRTNKCTNGKRYTVNEIKKKMKDTLYELYSVKVKDKYSDLGLVGVIGINDNNLDLFSLSCRALGRGVEERMIDYIYQRSINEIVWSSTGKNDELWEKLHILKEK